MGAFHFVDHRIDGCTGKLIHKNGTVVMPVEPDLFINAIRQKQGLVLKIDFQAHGDQVCLPAN